MGVKIMVDGEVVFEQDKNVPMIHVLTPTGEAATLRCQSGDFAADYNYEINLVLDPAQGGIYLDEIEQAEREENRERLEGNESMGTNRNRMGVSDEQLEQLEKDNQARLNPEQQVGGTPSEEEVDENGEKKEKLSL